MTNHRAEVAAFAHENAHCSALRAIVEEIAQKLAGRAFRRATPSVEETVAGCIFPHCNTAPGKRSRAFSFGVQTHK
jgi:hypothetical protein